MLDLTSKVLVICTFPDSNFKLMFNITIRFVIIKMLRWEKVMVTQTTTPAQLTLDYNLVVLIHQSFLALFDLDPV